MNGIIVIKKEKDFTSFDVVAKLRGILKQKKIGHTGTLDPEATGVLPVCLGNATKLCDMLTDKKKEYIAEFVLGKTTDTQDIWGSILSESQVTCNEVDIRTCAMDFQGDIMQVPPMYSALKVNGKKLYELARQGIEVERKARPVTIYELEVMRVNVPNVQIRVLCSKGTYIRTLIHDMGQKLGCGATMTSLERTKSGQFSIDKAYTLKEVEEIRDAGKLDEIILPVDEVFMHMPGIILENELEKKILNGNLIYKNELVNCMYGYDELYQNADTEKVLLSLKNDNLAADLCKNEQKIRVYINKNNKCSFSAIYIYSKEKHGMIPEKMFLT